MAFKSVEVEFISNYSLGVVPLLKGSETSSPSLSNDKARVPIGIIAANKQSPMTMHVEYRVSLLDHDWVVAEQHKLIPSVYAGIEIQPNGLGNPEAVEYSGPTYIAIRSGKHCSYTAFAHGLDFGRLLSVSEFEKIVKSVPEKSVKPVIFLTVDGGPDENPRYQNVIDVAVHHFLSHDLDGFFVATNAPGRSVFNHVERKTVPLSRELSGLILPYDHYGTHLDNQRRTMDLDLEKRNFAFAGSTQLSPRSGQKLWLMSSLQWLIILRTDKENHRLKKYCRGQRNPLKNSHAIFTVHQFSLYYWKGFARSVTRPVRIAAVRQRQMMAIIAREENGEKVDWMDEEEWIGWNSSAKES
ncbi:hypothetical protein DAPPUDRAFT_246118 [Daphnia pulex]|uniref:Uncharacterized protein n=1 Tax=Daphnia pulex TaxID=6669 RepID=E9GPN9_DAPPU|nr:hypothetical protein DAPPUDRAFT_246118 [Daphnia pulex]|eukprot:EFX78416.1 hypothetical protein DAPPUDRAFT_246118 [Daphnia pulex]